MELFDELVRLVAALEQRDVEYALCGGLAMAVHGHARFTRDIDLLIRKENLEAAQEIAKQLGYTHAPPRMVFGRGATEIQRVVKLSRDNPEPLMIDMLVVTDVIEDVWRDREQVEWQEGAIWVVSREGLIKLKSLRDSDLDKIDIKHLRGNEE